MNKHSLRFLSASLHLKRIATVAFLTLTGLAMTAPQATALRINLDFSDLSPPPINVRGSDPLGSGEPDAEVTLPSQVNVQPTQLLLNNAVGGGNLFDIVRAAADCWELAIEDDFTINLRIGVAPLATEGIIFGGINGAGFVEAPFDGVLGLHIINNGQQIPLQDGTSVFRETEGTILFNSNPSVNYFLDPTPRKSEEFSAFFTTEQNLGGGLVNTERVASALSSAANQGFDLFTVALHEIGHALGLSSVNPAAIIEVSDSDIDVRTPLPFAGTRIPVDAQEVHFVSISPLFLSNSVGFPTLRTRQRRLLSGIDVLAVAEISKYQDVNLQPCDLCDNPRERVPEPSTLSALFAIAGALVASCKRLRTRLSLN